MAVAAKVHQEAVIAVVGQEAQRGVDGIFLADAAEIDFHAGMKHKKKKTKVSEKLDPLAAELHVEETFSKNYAEKNLHYRRRESQQSAQAGKNGRGQGDEEKRFSLIEDHNRLSTNVQIIFKIPLKRLSDNVILRRQPKNLKCVVNTLTYEILRPPWADSE